MKEVPEPDCLLNEFCLALTESPGFDIRINPNDASDKVFVKSGAYS